MCFFGICGEAFKWFNKSVTFGGVGHCELKLNTYLNYRVNNVEDFKMVMTT